MTHHKTTQKKPVGFWRGVTEVMDYVNVATTVFTPLEYLAKF